MKNNYNEVASEDCGVSSETARRVLNTFASLKTVIKINLSDLRRFASEIFGGDSYSSVEYDGECFSVVADASDGTTWEVDDETVYSCLSKFYGVKVSNIAVANGYDPIIFIEYT